MPGLPGMRRDVGAHRELRVEGELHAAQPAEEQPHSLDAQFPCIYSHRCTQLAWSVRRVCACACARISVGFS